MRNAILFLFAGLVFFGAASMIAITIFKLQAKPDAATVALGKREVDAYRKYSKVTGEPFMLGQTGFTVKDFNYQLLPDSVRLRVNVSVRHAQGLLSAANFMLRDDVLDDSSLAFIPAMLPPQVLAGATTQLQLTYQLPAMKISTLAYFLHIQPSNDRDTKAIVSIAKSYRSGG